jgi:hypothetical protein
VLLNGKLADSEGGDVLGTHRIMLILFCQKILLKKSHETFTILPVLNSKSIEFALLIICAKRFNIVVGETVGQTKFFFVLFSSS